MLSGLNAGNQAQRSRRCPRDRASFNAVRLERRKSGIHDPIQHRPRVDASMLSGLNAGNQALAQAPHRRDAGASMLSSLNAGNQGAASAVASQGSASASMLSGLNAGNQAVGST